jgi:hypothetical protein
MLLKRFSPFEEKIPMNIGCQGKVFYAYFVCRFDDCEYKVSVEVNETDTPAIVAKKLQEKADEIEREALERSLTGFAFFQGDYDRRESRWTITKQESRYNGNSNS